MCTQEYYAKYFNDDVSPHYRLFGSTDSMASSQVK